MIKGYMDVPRNILKQMFMATPLTWATPLCDPEGASQVALNIVIPGGFMSENKNVGELHGCIVCARLFNILAVYAPDGRLVDCTVTSPGGHIVPDKRRPLVACDTHTAGEIALAYKRWQSTNG